MVVAAGTPVAHRFRRTPRRGGLRSSALARHRKRRADSRSQTLESIRSFLRADESLSEESAEAITSVLRAAYDQLAQRQEVPCHRARAPLLSLTAAGSSKVACCPMLPNQWRHELTVLP